MSNPKRKDYKPHQSTKYNPLYCGGGSIKQQLERGPHSPPINVQKSVAYNNPNQHCTPANLATYYNSQSLTDTFTTAHVRTFGVRTLCKWALKSVSPLLTSSLIRYSANIGLLVRLSITKAARKLILPL